MALIEETVVRAVECIEHDEAVWLADANTVLVGKHLRPEQVDRALVNLAAQWRRSFIRLVA